MIFIRKQLFSGQDKKSQLGLIISAHIIHETQLMSSMDVERFVFTLFNQKLCDENTIFVLDLLIYNIEKLYKMVSTFANCSTSFNTTFSSDRDSMHV